MKILILDEEFPFPTNSGKRTRSFNLYRRLAKRFRVHYVGFGESDSVAEEALKAQGIAPIVVPGRVPRKQGLSFYVRLLVNLYSPLPYIVTSHYSNRYRIAVRDALAKIEPEVVVCEWTPYTIYVKNLLSFKKIVSTHNIEADIWQRYFENEARGLRRWYIYNQWRKVKEFERASLCWVNGGLAVSELDRRRLAKWCPGLPTAVVPNGVDLDYFHVLPQAEVRRNLVFTGSMDWRPNQDAARYFVREILPLLRQLRADLECTFVGRSPPADIQALANVPGVHITGTVEDVRPYVERAAVYVVPLRIGGGSRLKILEAMAMGRAVVSTTVGAEGLDVIHDQHLILADDPRTFAESVLRLLDDPEQCQKLAMQGRYLVEQYYGWDALADHFGDFIHEIVAGEGSSALAGKTADLT